MRRRFGPELLQLPVRLYGLQLGRPVDLILYPDGLRAVGFDVLCRDGVRRFLPLAAATLAPDEIAVQSALLLLDEEQASFYRRNGVTLSALLGSVVEQAGVARGRLRDLVFGEAGAVTAVFVEADGGGAEIAVDETVRIRRGAASAA
jgi:hypothetical protein